MEFEPIVLRYEGLYAERRLIDLWQVGASIQGASQLLGSAGHLVVTGDYAKRSHALAVKVMAGVPSGGSWDLPAVIMTAAPVIMPLFPAMADMGKKAATAAVTQGFQLRHKKTQLQQE